MPSLEKYVDPDQLVSHEKSADQDLHFFHPNVDFCLFDSLRPINNLSVIKGQVFLG